LTNQILKIYLVDGQKSMAEMVVAGSFCSIRKLRWKYSHVDGCIRAQLGGTERLIAILNPNNTNNEHLNGLLRQATVLSSCCITTNRFFSRRESWEKNKRSPAPAPLKQTSHQAEDRPEAKERDPACVLIKDIPPPQRGPMRLKVYARPVSFYPMHLDDAFYQFCARCKIEYV
jgi:hypothetical protein